MAWHSFCAAAALPLRRIASHRVCPHGTAAWRGIATALHCIALHSTASHGLSGTHISDQHSLVSHHIVSYRIAPPAPPHRATTHRVTHYQLPFPHSSTRIVPGTNYYNLASAPRHVTPPTIKLGTPNSKDKARASRVPRHPERRRSFDENPWHVVVISFKTQDKDARRETRKEGRTEGRNK